MYFIDKNALTTKIPISNLEKSILENPHIFSKIEKQDLLNKLLKYKDNFWIICDCNRDKSLLVICILNGATYLRCKVRKEHIKSCRFYIAGQILLDNSSNSSMIQSSRCLRYNLYPIVSEITKSNQSSNTGGGGSRVVSKLGQALYTAIVDSKINLIDSSKPYLPLIEQLQNVATTFNDPAKIIYKDIYLKRFYRYSLTQETLTNAENQLINAAKWFPQHIKPFMLFTTIATTLATHEFTIKKDNSKFRVSTQISLPSNWIDLQKSAPYFLLLSTILDASNKIFIKHAFALPILSTVHLIPIESNYERTILKIILGLVRNRYNVIIEKPLFYLCDDNKNKYRPDFILTNSNGKSIYIEVLGGKNEEYLKHKGEIELIARKYCDSYISVKAYSLILEYQTFVSHLQYALDRISI